MPLCRVRTTDESVQRVQPMYQAGVNKEVQSSIDLGRCSGACLTVKDLKYVVGANGFVAAPDQLQDPTSNGRKAQAAFRAQSLSGSQCIGHTTFVVVHGIVDGLF